MASSRRLYSSADQNRSHGRNSGKSGITRVRTGCFTCRKRKKKCDEQRPVCNNCQKTGIICDGFPLPSHWEPRATRSRSTTTRTQPMMASGSTDIPLITDALTQEMLAFTQDDYTNMMATSRSSGSTTQEHDYLLETQFQDDLDFLDSHTAREDPPSPLSLGSLQTRSVTTLTSSQEDHREVLPVGQLQGARKDMEVNYSVGNRIPRELPFLIAGVDTPIHQRLFCHFTRNMSRLLTLSNGDSNPLNSVVIPFALQDRTMMDTILCLAGSHLLKLQNAEQDFELRHDVYQLHESAVQAQSFRINIFNDWPHSGSICTVTSQEIMLATSLLLCLYEICEGTGNDAWRNHLNVARQILKHSSTTSPQAGPQQRLLESVSTTQPAPLNHQANINSSGYTLSASRNSCEEPQANCSSDINPFLLEFFMYHDSLASVTVRSLPFTQPLECTIMNLPEADSYVIGPQDGLMDFISRISALRTQADMSPYHPDGDVVCKALFIWEDLARWHPRPSAAGERKLIAEFYQWALFIWLFSIVYPEGKADMKVQQALHWVLDGLNSIPRGAGVRSCLLFPLFVIGSAAIEKEDRAAISEHFRNLRAWSALGNISLTFDIIEKMWYDHDLGVPGSWDWVKQLESVSVSVLVG